MVVYVNGPGPDTITGTGVTDNQFQVETFRNVYGPTTNDNDTLTGNAGVDRFQVTLGEDVIDGKGGPDILDFGATFEAIIPFSFTDTFFTRDETIFVTDITVNLAAGTYEALWAWNLGEQVIDALVTKGTFSSIEWIYGGRGKDTIIGTSGDDQFYLSRGGGSIAGGDGKDRIISRFVNDNETPYIGVSVDAAEGRLTNADGKIYEFSSIERFMLTDQADTFVGSNADERVTPGYGADILDGSGGYDYLRYSSDYGYTTMGVTVDLGRGRANLPAFLSLPDTTQTFKNFEGVFGTDGADKITGTSGQNVFFGEDTFDNLNFNGGGGDTLIGKGGGDILVGGGGDDIIKGGGGADAIYGSDVKVPGEDDVSEITATHTNSGADTLFGGNGTDEIDGGDGNDSLDGGNGQDVMFGGAGDDKMSGGGGDDFLFGGQVEFRNEDRTEFRSFSGSGIDVISGGKGNDFVFGGDGADTLGGDGGNDFVFGDEDDDDISGGGGKDTLDGGEGKDRIEGGGGHDTVFGDDGNDRLDGGAGKDRLDGGDGNDRMTGGRDADVFVLTKGRDQITDFELKKDVIDVAADRGPSYADFQSLARDVVDIKARDTVIRISNDTSLTINDVKFENLTPDHFIFPEL